MTKEEELEEGVVYYVTTEDHPNRECLMKYKNNGFVDLEDKTTCVFNFTYYKADTYTKATPAQIKHYEACMKAGKYVEPEEVKLEEWGEGTYVVIIDNYHSVDIGDVHKIGFNIFKDCIDIEESVGKTCFPNKDCCKWFATKQEAEEFAKTLKEPIVYEPPTEAQQYIVGCDPATGSSMVISNPNYKSERYIKTMEFFNQLREPEKSQAIANYNEGFDKQVPSKLREAVGYGFNWADSPERHIYWENICSNIRNNTCFNTKEAVHCPTQEEFDYVTEKLGYKWSLTYPFHKYTTDSCIEIGLHCYRRKSDFEGYIILSFQEWCTENNHEGLKPWVAQIGDWVMIHEKELPIHSNWLGEGGRISHQGPYKVTSIGTFNEVTKLDDISTSLGQSRFRKATQAEIDSVNKGFDYDIDKPQWTYNNWYVEVSSQEEADMVIEAAAKMYSKPINKVRKFVSDWKYVSFDFEGDDFSVFTLKHLPKLPKPRPISDFITINDSSIFPIETMKAHLRRLDKPYQQYPLTPSESFKVKSNPKLLDNNVSKISSINISLKQKSKSKKL
jgi:hypothetical protein